MNFINFLLLICITSMVYFAKGFWHRVPHKILTRTKQSMSRQSQFDLSSCRFRLITDLWKQIAFPSPSLESQQFLFCDYGLDQRQTVGILQHFLHCRDFALENAFITPTKSSYCDDEAIDGFLLQHINFPIFSQDDDYDAEEEITNAIDFRSLHNNQGILPVDFAIFPSDSSDENIIQITDQWIKRVVVKLNLCPFFCSYLRRESFSNNIIDISISKSDTIEKAFHAFWEEVQSFYQSTNQISCSVIVFPELQLFGNYELFELFTDSVNQGFKLLEVNSEISAWGFHPKYQYRDGEDRIATSNIQHNRLDEFADEYGRRSPWPCFVLKKETLVDENDRTIFNQHLLERRNALQDVGAANFKRMLKNLSWEEFGGIRNNPNEYLNLADEVEKWILSEVD